MFFTLVKLLRPKTQLALCLNDFLSNKNKKKLKKTAVGNNLVVSIITYLIAAVKCHSPFFSLLKLIRCGFLRYLATTTHEPCCLEALSCSGWQDVYLCACLNLSSDFSSDCEMR